MLCCLVCCPSSPPETVLIAKANCASAVHHHGEQGGFCRPRITTINTQHDDDEFREWEILLTTLHLPVPRVLDTIIYAASGKGVLVTNPHDDVEKLQRHELSAGDFAFVPPWTEHQELNETDEDVVWVLIRSGPHPVVVYMTDWGGAETKAD